MTQESLLSNLGRLKAQSGEDSEDGSWEDSRLQATDDENDRGTEEAWISSISFLLRSPLWPFSCGSPLIMWSFSRLTSDSFTGLTMYSSAPSSKQLFIIEKMEAFNNLP